MTLLQSEHGLRHGEHVVTVYDTLRTDLSAQGFVTAGGHVTSRMVVLRRNAPVRRLVFHGPGESYLAFQQAFGLRVYSLGLRMGGCFALLCRPLESDDTPPLVAHEQSRVRRQVRGVIHLPSLNSWASQAAFRKALKRVPEGSVRMLPDPVGVLLTHLY